MDTTNARALLKASIAKHGKPAMDVDNESDDQVASAMGYLSSRAGWLELEERQAMRAEYERLKPDIGRAGGV